MEERNHDQKLTRRNVSHKKLDAAGWGLFFIWTGIALFTNVGWGAGLLGVGIIVIGGILGSDWILLCFRWGLEVVYRPVRLHANPLYRRRRLSSGVCVGWQSRQFWIMQTPLNPAIRALIGGKRNALT